MRKVTREIVEAFRRWNKKTIGNTSTDGKSIFLHGNEIATKDRNGVKGIFITSAGWETNTTKERLNGLPGVSIQQKKRKWYLNGKEWDGEWERIR